MPRGPPDATLQIDEIVHGVCELLDQYSQNETEAEAAAAARPTKRKKKAIARGIAHADRKEVKAKKKFARRGLRLEGRQLY